MIKTKGYGAGGRHGGKSISINCSNKSSIRRRYSKNETVGRDLRGEFGGVMNGVTAGGRRAL